MYQWDTADKGQKFIFNEIIRAYTCISVWLSVPLNILDWC